MCAATLGLAKKRRRSGRGLPADPAARLAITMAGRGSGASEAVGCFYNLLCRPRSGVVEESIAAWLRVFAQIGSPDLESRHAKLARLAHSNGIDASRFRPAELLFALHSYYALIVKLVDAECDVNRVPRAGSESDQSPAGEFDPFDWVFAANEDGLSPLVEQIACRLRACDLSRSPNPDNPRDLFQPLYEALLPKQARHALGEYYTPVWLAEHVLDELGYDGDPRRRLLDPACGSGVFLLAALHRVRAWHARHGAKHSMGEVELVPLVQANIVGCDLNPLAVLTARVNYRLAIEGILDAQSVSEGGRDAPSLALWVSASDSSLTLRATSPIHQCDSILAPPPMGTFDYIAGNPPWVAWDNLPAEYRAATRPLWEKYGLFSLSGKEARHGGGKKDLSMLMLYAAADRHLAKGGKLGFVITQTLLQTSGAGDGFRRFRLGPEGEWLGVTRVDDFVATRPFDAANWTSVLFLEKGKRTEYPVHYVRWAPVATSSFQKEECLARPIDPLRSNSPWLIESAASANSSCYAVGPSDYTAHLGANTGGANGVFWVRILEHYGEIVLIENLAECGKKPARRVRALLEPDLLYPLVRWSDVSRNCVTPSAYLLLAQDPKLRRGIDEERMQRDYPLTYRYLKSFEQLLRERAAYQRYQGHAPFYSMYDVAEYTLAPHKVIWRRMDKQITAAAASEIDDPHLGRRPLIPQETCVLIACESRAEADYLCALLNSPQVNQIAQSHGVRGGKGFGSPAMLAHLNLRKFSANGTQAHDLIREPA
jgi:hypothetical protein